ncbi:SDR family oxidoreductase [Thauera aminoaromatica]|jgi:nucleoside-diphosphate-sugar epimerase|uniref:SDR family oxidoreductase n=2 Tax=Thauera aminoaromatica TaxID=164330 RepID=A0A5C7T5F1_THASP|nr:SDR family oxidoreductase [Thauera aminoaromatica]MBL8461229.1 SDR family oxidoreductase [Thauera sp.]MDA0234525.1 SDR family oxidoreductase [Pseudomonadota bacterium]TXH91528.1 MAG: SDR family oxidoreductase [Thauera aminoaromatica]HNC66509.1 SDR family oxidoreductase [Thauera aminoaromatica]HND58419.1 SDR family oxidoreductase [Thauera aminoaromatica]
MKRILIVGSGDVARRALPWLVRRFRVFALVRQPEAAAELRALGAVPVAGDLDDRRSLRRLAGIADAVLHFAPPPQTGEGDPRMARLLAALAGRSSLPQGVVYISTTGVYGDCAGVRVDETRPCRAQTARGRRRVDAERRLRAFGRRNRVRVALLRAPGIYAADRLPLERLRRGDPVLAADEDVHTNHIHAEDLARIACLALFRAGPGRAYNASDDSGLRMGEYFDAVAERFGLARPPRMARAEIVRHLSPLALSFMSESRRLDNRRLKRELRLHLRYPTVADGLRAATVPV